MDIKKLKKELGISNKDIAGFFDMSYGAYANSTAKKRYEEALCNFYSFLINEKTANPKQHNDESQH